MDVAALSTVERDVRPLSIPGSQRTVSAGREERDMRTRQRGREQLKGHWGHGHIDGPRFMIQTANQGRIQSVVTLAPPRKKIAPRQDGTT